MKKKIVSVTVTYNRLEKLKVHIEKLLNQSIPLDQIYIIDNHSTDGTFEYMRDIKKKYSQITYCRMKENKGGSGGFYIGIKKAFHDKSDYIWGMDDDAYPKENALQELVDFYRKKKELCCLWSNCDCDKDIPETGKKVREWMFVGFFLPAQIIKKVGLPKEGFFIYHDDSEYAYRIQKKGYSIWKVRDSLIEHQDYKEREKYQKKIFGKTLEYPILADWRVYYEIRNRILKYSWTDQMKYRTIIEYVPKTLIIIIMVNPKQFKIALKGYIHGIIGKDGIVMKP